MVAREQQRIGEPRRMEMAAGDRALDGENRLGGDARTLAVLLPAAAEFTDFARFTGAGSRSIRYSLLFSKT